MGFRACRLPCVYVIAALSLEMTVMGMDRLLGVD
jgi:hypothetical protein